MVLTKNACEKILDDIQVNIRPRFNDHLLFVWYPVINGCWKELFVILNENDKLGFAFGVGETIYVYARTDNVYDTFRQDKSWQNTWVGWTKFERIGL